jgi:hypothetical protein
VDITLDVPDGNNRQLDGTNVGGLEAARNSRLRLSRICDPFDRERMLQM